MRSAEPGLGPHPPRRYAPGVPPRGDTRSCVPSFRARYFPRSVAKTASPEGRLRADARAPWTRRGEHPRVVDGVKAWWRHAGCEPAQERARSLALGHSGSMSTATVPSAYAFFRVMRTRPSWRCSNRSCAIGGARSLASGHAGHSAATPLDLRRRARPRGWPRAG